jgi:hypothetical protein
MFLSFFATVPLGNFEGIGPLGNIHRTTSTNFYFAYVISIFIGVMTAIAGLWFVFQIFQGAFQWLSSGGDKQQLQTAQKRLQNAFTGILVVVLAYTLVGIVGRILGLDILNLGMLLFNLAPQ